MGAPRFILDHLNWPANQVFLKGDDLAHCRSLRLKPKDKVLIGDGHGRAFHGELIHLDAQQATVQLGQEYHPHTESPLNLTLYQGLTKGSKLELIIQKTTELGVSRVVPVISAFSQVKIHQEREHKQHRYVEIARQACQQSGRLKIPEVSTPVTMAEALQQGQGQDLVLLFHQEPDLRSLTWTSLRHTYGQAQTISLFVGPEGGFSHDEVTQAQEQGVHIITLGPRILRAETAGMVVVALAQETWGDLGGPLG